MVIQNTYKRAKIVAMQTCTPIYFTAKKRLFTFTILIFVSVVCRTIVVINMVI